MSKQFKAAEVFNQDLTGWCVYGITSEPTEFVNLSSALIEANKPLWGKEFTVALTSGSNSQTVTFTNAITDIVYTATPICAGSISASASGLPSGVSMVFANNVATISGSANGSGTIYYSLAFTGASTSQTVTGTITINAAATTNNSGSISFINGTCQCPNATAGDTDVINGVTYTAVDNSTIAGQIANSNVNLCTTLVTSMQNLFSGKANFNSDIGFWDTSNVTNMDRMFENASSFNQDISGWCVSNINSEPINFLFSSALTEANKPLWGKEFTVALTTGSNSQTVTGTTAITDIKYTTTPICAGSISASVSGLPSGVTLAFGNNVATISGSANATGTFNYTLTFTGASTSEAVTGTITVNAAADTTAPVITLTGSSTINLTVGDTFTDPGATATDAVDGDLTSSITSSGSVDTSTAGTYTISYNVSDAAGNAATVVQRTVIVSVAVASIYFENGTCKCPNATAGDTEVINGVTYTAVDNSTIAGQIAPYNSANNNFNLCTTLVTSMNGSIANGQVTNFFNNFNFNSDISFWDTSNVVNMSHMFNGQQYFNQDISNWNTSSVTDMSYMLGGTSEFTQNIGSWDTSNVTNMEGMFSGARIFTGIISGWDVSSVTNMSSMFQNTRDFNGAIGGWDVSSVTNMNYMFMGTVTFNQDIGNWDVSNVAAMDYMFVTGSSSFNQNLSLWCVTNITSEPTFVQNGSGLSDFNKPIWGTCPDYNIDVTASSNSDYTLAGSDRNGAISGNDPSITINIGDEVNFIVNAASHPFYIKTAQGTGTDNQVSNVTNNGATSGVVNWTPTAAGTYYYQCSAHNGMYGTITVQ